MKHEKYPGHSGYMTITMSVEDWIWWCKFLSQLLKSFESPEAFGPEPVFEINKPIEMEDLEIIERAMQSAEEADHVATRHN